MRLATLLCFHFVVSLERDRLLGREVDVTVDIRIREIRSIEDIAGLEKGDRVFYGLDIDIEYWGDLLVGFGAPASTADFNVSERLSAATDEHYYGIYMYPNSSYWILPNHLYHESYSNNPRPGNSEITRFKFRDINPGYFRDKKSDPFRNNFTFPTYDESVYSPEGPSPNLTLSNGTTSQSC